MRFFSKIRQQFFTGNGLGRQKLANYLAYALGEIILVVTGILIALSLNNWNDVRKDAKAENLYYLGLKNDLETDQKIITDFLQKANHRIEVGKELLVDLEKSNRNKNYLMNSFLEAIRGDIFFPADVTYTDLLSSGNINLIKDVPLKNAIIQFYNDQENVIAQLKQNRDEIVKESFSLINSSVGFGAAEFDYLKNSLGPEISNFIPNDNWVSDKKSQGYQHFQRMIIFNIAMAEREKQHLYKIQQLMKTPLELLMKKCQ